MKSFKSILNQSEAMIEIEKSKFIATITPVSTEDEAIAFIYEIKKKRYDASHNVSAYYLREQHNLKRYSDDGEPSGSSGMPSLHVFVTNGVMDVCVVITRYFGGTKLGVGGLARAYSEATNQAMQKAEVILYHLMTQYKITVSYDLYNKLIYLFANNGVLIGETDFQENVTLQIYLTEKQNNIIEDIQNLSASNATIENVKSLYVYQKDGRIIRTKELL